MREGRRRRRLRRVAVCAACLVLACLQPAAAFAGEPGLLDAIQPAPQLYTLQGFGLDPLGLAGPRISASLDPPRPDGYFGWYVTPLRVTLSADRPSSIRFCWDDPSDASAWKPYEVPLLVPEGKHVLYTQASDARGAGPLSALQVKVDFRSLPVNGAEFASLGAVVPAGTVPPQSGAVSVFATILPSAGPRIVRIGGVDRYETSELIALDDFKKSRYAILARGDLFPDALSASGLAGYYKAPIVLTKPKVLTPAASAAFKSLGTTNIVIVGSNKAVSDGVASQLTKQGFKVQRIGGIDRYETASLIGREVVKLAGAKGKAFVTRGDLFPDSLAVSPFAYRDCRPILLVRPTAMPSCTRDAIRQLGIKNVLIAGSEAAVSKGVAGGIAASGVGVERQGGINRYVTAIDVAEWGSSQKLGGWFLIGLATGQRFPDALCGGAAVGNLGGVMLMTPIEYLYPAVGDELTRHGVELRDIQVYGSEAAVSKTVWEGIVRAIR